jgi:hypothetical protein
MNSMMRPGRKYRLCVQGTCAFVEGFFRNNIFYEGDHSPIRTGFVDTKSRLFYRHGSSLAEQHFRIDLMGRLAGLTLLAPSGSRYLLVEDDNSPDAHQDIEPCP